MIRPICKDVFFLSQKSRDYTPADRQITEDLADTLLHHRDGCVGTAANMIGAAVRVIAFFDGDILCVLCNPELVWGKEPYETEEGCLSLNGVRKTTRYARIKIRYETPEGSARMKTYTGIPAQIVQHELDHTMGTII